MNSIGATTPASVSGISYRDAEALQGMDAFAATSDNWLTNLINALMQGTQPQEASAAGTAEAAALPSGLMLDDAISTSIKKQLVTGELASYTSSLSETQPITAADKEKEISGRLSAIKDTDPLFSYNINPAVYNKMAADPAFSSRVEDMLDKAVNHPFMTADIPGVVGRSIHVNEDGEVIVMLMRRVGENEAEESELEALIKELLDEMEDDVYSILIDYDPEATSITTEELMRQMAEDYWLKRAEEVAGIAEPDKSDDADGILDEVPQIAV